MTDEIEAIRARHEETHRKYTAQGITLDGAAAPRAHVDRATLLRLLDAAREELREVREAAKLFPYLADGWVKEPTDDEDLWIARDKDSGAFASEITFGMIRRLAAALAKDATT